MSTRPSPSRRMGGRSHSCVVTPSGAKTRSSSPLPTAVRSGCWRCARPPATSPPKVAHGTPPETSLPAVTPIGRRRMSIIGTSAETRTQRTVHPPRTNWIGRVAWARDGSELFARTSHVCLKCRHSNWVDDCLDRRIPSALARKRSKVSFRWPSTATSQPAAEPAVLTADSGNRPAHTPPDCAHAGRLPTRHPTGSR